MLVTVYGEGGFDPEKPNNNIIEQYDDVVEVEPEMKQIPQTALNTLSQKLNDPSINSIAEIKSILKDFIQEIQ